VLDQEADEPIQRAEDRAGIMTVDAAGCPHRVLESEALGLLEIELDRGALPLAADGVVKLNVDFRSVERPSALVDAVRGAAGG